MGSPRIPPWLRRGVEAGSFAAALAIGTLLASRLTPGVTPVVLPAGPAASILLALPVLALSVVAVAYPVAFAATRMDAGFGAVAGFLIGADLTSLVEQTRIFLPSAGLSVPLGLFVSLLALVPAIAALVVSQAAGPFGFGRRAGTWAAITAAIVAAPILLAASRLG